MLCQLKRQHAPPPGTGTGSSSDTAPTAIATVAAIAIAAAVAAAIAATFAIKAVEHMVEGRRTGQLAAPQQAQRASLEHVDARAS